MRSSNTAIRKTECGRTGTVAVPWPWYPPGAARAPARSLRAQTPPQTGPRWDRRYNEALARQNGAEVLVKQRSWENILACTSTVPYPSIDVLDLNQEHEGTQR